MLIAGYASLHGVFMGSLTEKETFEQILEDGEGPGPRDI